MSEMGEPYFSSQPPPPEKPRRGRMVGIVEIVIALCLCLVVVAGIIYVQRYKIPFVANFFPSPTPIPSPTPVGIQYSNTALGVSLYYPTGWMYNEDDSGGMVAFSNYQDMLNGTAFLEDGILLMLIRPADMGQELPADVDPNSPEELVQLILSEQGNMLSEDNSELEPLRSYSINGKPAASAAYLNTQPDIPNYVLYLVVIVTDDIPVIAVAVCPQAAWETQHAVIDGVLDTLEIRPIQ